MLSDILRLPLIMHIFCLSPFAAVQNVVFSLSTGGYPSIHPAPRIMKVDKLVQFLDSFTSEKGLSTSPAFNVST